MCWSFLDYLCIKVCTSSIVHYCTWICAFVLGNEIFHSSVYPEMHLLCMFMCPEFFILLVKCTLVLSFLLTVVNKCTFHEEHQTTQDVITWRVQKNLCIYQRMRFLLLRKTACIICFFLQFVEIHKS